MLAIEVDFNLAVTRVVRTLERIATTRGYPLKLRLDNGPELNCVTLADWAEQHAGTLEFIKPGKPMQNGFIERLNRSLPCLSGHPKPANDGHLKTGQRDSRQGR